MPLRIRAGCAIAVVFLFVFTSVVSAQHPALEDGPVRAVAQEQSPSADDFLAQTAQEATLEWLWGEVTQVDPVSGMVTVKYLDYDTDTEKEMAVTVDDKTTFENAASVADIALGDTLSIDYMVVGGGIRARNISVEKAMPEGISTEEAIQEGPMPEEAQAPAENSKADPGVQEMESVPDVSSVPAE